MSAIERIKASESLYSPVFEKSEIKNEKIRKLFASCLQEIKANQNQIDIDDPSITHFPGFLEILNAPLSSIRSAIDFIKAIRKNDLEGKIDSQLQFHRSNLSFSYAMINGITKICTVAFLDIPSIYYYIASTTIPFLGLLLCSVEALSELSGLRRGICLLKSLNNDLIRSISLLEKNRFSSKKIRYLKQIIPKLKSLGVDEDLIKKLKSHIKMRLSDENKSKIKSDLSAIKRKIIDRDLSYIFNKYFSLKAKETLKISEYINSKYEDKGIIKKKIERLTRDSLAVKKANLARRVRPHVADMIENKLPLVLSNLKFDKNEKKIKTGVNQGKKIIEVIDTQCQKRILIHAIGLIALTFMIVGFALAIAGCPYLAVTILLTIGGLLALERSILSRVLLDSNGWQFEWHRVIPKWALPYFQIVKRAILKPQIQVANYTRARKISQFRQSEISGRKKRLMIP